MSYAITFILERFEQVVEPDHDERAETCSVCGGRGWHTAGGNDPAACGACAAGEAWYGGGEWQPDERTVKAVVEALREMRDVSGGWFFADRIEARFNLSEGRGGR